MAEHRDQPLPHPRLEPGALGGRPLLRRGHLDARAAAPRRARRRWRARWPARTSRHVHSSASTERGDRRPRRRGRRSRRARPPGRRSGAATVPGEVLQVGAGSAGPSSRARCAGPRPPRGPCRGGRGIAGRYGEATEWCTTRRTPASRAASSAAATYACSSGCMLGAITYSASQPVSAPGRSAQAARPSGTAPGRPPAHGAAGLAVCRRGPRPAAHASSKSAKSKPGETRQLTSASASARERALPDAGGHHDLGLDHRPATGGPGRSAGATELEGHACRCAPARPRRRRTRCHAEDSPAGSRKWIRVAVGRTRPSGSVTDAGEAQVCRYQPPSGCGSSSSVSASAGVAQVLQVQPRGHRDRAVRSLDRGCRRRPRRASPPARRTGAPGRCRVRRRGRRCGARRVVRPARRRAAAAARPRCRRASSATKSRRPRRRPRSAKPTTAPSRSATMAAGTSTRRASSRNDASCASRQRVGHVAVVRVVPGRVPDPGDRGHVVAASRHAARRQPRRSTSACAAPPESRA